MEFETMVEATFCGTTGDKQTRRCSLVIPNMNPLRLTCESACLRFITRPRRDIGERTTNILSNIQRGDFEQHTKSTSPITRDTILTIICWEQSKHGRLCGRGTTEDLMTPCAPEQYHTIIFRLSHLPNAISSTPADLNYKSVGPGVDFLNLHR